VSNHSSRQYRCIAKVRDVDASIRLERRVDNIVLLAEIGGIRFSACSPGPETHGLLLIGIGCALKEDERFRPIYEAMKKVAEEKP
jgi:hypothetical protein